MTRNYPVFFAGRYFGKVQVSEDGLYYRFFCRCGAAGELTRCLVLEGVGELGILIPVDDGLGLETRIPRKRVGRDCTWEFRLSYRHDRPTSPIYPAEPFSYLQTQKNAFLMRRESSESNNGIA